MLVSTVFSAPCDQLANALSIGVASAKARWLKAVRAYAMQVRPEADTPAYASARVLAAPFTFRVVLNGDERAAHVVHTLDEVRLAKGAAKLAALDPASFARIVTGAAEAWDGEKLLQLALFGAIRFDLDPVVAAPETASKPRIAAASMAQIIAGLKEGRK